MSTAMSNHSLKQNSTTRKAHANWRQDLRSLPIRSPKNCSNNSTNCLTGYYIIGVACCIYIASERRVILLPIRRHGGWHRRMPNARRSQCSMFKSSSPLRSYCCCPFNFFIPLIIFASLMPKQFTKEGGCRNAEQATASTAKRIKTSSILIRMCRIQICRLLYSNCVYGFVRMLQLRNCGRECARGALHGRKSKRNERKWTEMTN